MNRIPDGSARAESGRTHTSQRSKSTPIVGALRRVGVVLGAVVLAGSFFSIFAGSSGAAPVPTAPFHECPGVGDDTSCQVLIVLNADGSTSILQDTTQHPYDGFDDTLVGVLNNTTSPVTSINLSAVSSGNDIFNFDGDGICGKNNGHDFTWVGTGSNGFGFAGCPYGTTGYEGPWVTFSNYGSAINHWETGTVSFSTLAAPSPPTGLAAGSSTFFSLESNLSAASFSIPPTTTTTAAPTTTTTAPTVPTTGVPSGPPTVPPTTPPATVPSGAPGTGVGGAATSSDNGVLLTGSGMALFAGLAGLALIARRRRSA